MARLATPLLPAPPVQPPAGRKTLRYTQRQLTFLTQHYCHYTLLELEVLMGIPWRKIQRLCRRYGIRKRKPNQKPHSRKKATSAAVSPIDNC